MSDSENVSCPVCKTKTSEDAVGSQGVVLAAARALVTGDAANITAAAAVSTPYDFHMAVTMFVDTLDMLSELMGVEVIDALDVARRQLNDSAAG